MSFAAGPLKSGKIARMVGVDRGTILNWVDNPLFTEFFSEAAQGDGSPQRSYDESDLILFLTIKELRGEGREWEAIQAALADGYRTRNIPVDTMMESSGQTAGNQMARTLQVVNERDRALAQIELYQEQIEQLRALRDVDQRTIRELEREIGRLEARLEWAEKGRE